MTSEELNERQQKELCFRCGGKWGRDHQCPLKNFRLVLLEGEDEEEEDWRDAMEAHEEENLELSLNSLRGLTSNKSYKVKRSIEESEVMVLIDSGASSNFISEKLVKRLKLTIYNVNSFMVEVVNGQVEWGLGVCPKVTLMVQRVKIEQPFFVIPMGTTDVVLGLDWLASLRKVEADFEKLSLTWQ